MSSPVALVTDGSPADLVDCFARRLPLAVICELLGLPAAERLKFWPGPVVSRASTVQIGLLGLIPAVLSMKRYLEARLVAARRKAARV